MKTARMVLNLTVAGFLSVELAAAEEPAQDAARPARFRFGVEQTIASFTHTSYKDSPATLDTLSWGFGATDLTADYAVVDHLELGLAAGVSGTRDSAAGPDGYGGSIEQRVIKNTIHLKPRVTLNIPVTRDLSVAPRLGIDYTRLTLDSERTGSSSWTEAEAAWFATPGVMLACTPAPWLYLGTGPELAYKVCTNSDSQEEGCFSDQGVGLWSINWLLGAGAKI
jgi:hypothetical protein